MANGQAAEVRLETHMLGTYASLRRLMAVVTLGFLAVLTTYRLMHWGQGPAGGVMDSISAYYYHTNADWPIGDVYIGALSAIGLLLIAYQGYTKRESWALNAAGTALLVVVFCPMDERSLGPNPPRARDLVWYAWVHYAAAVVFFLGLWYVSLFRSRDTLVNVSTEARRTAYRRSYQITGWLMILVPAVAVVLFAVNIPDYIYYAEYGGAVAFVGYWVVKSFELLCTRLETPARVDAYARQAPRLPGRSVADEMQRPTGGPDAPLPGADEDRPDRGR